MKKISKYICFIVALFAFSSLTAQKPANSSFIKNKTNVNIGYSWTNMFSLQRMHLMYLGGNYGLNNWLEAGLFIDGGRFSISYFAADETDEYGNSLQYRVKNNYIFRYGLNANIHVLHIFVNPDYYKFDIYVNPKIGLKSTIWGEAPDKPEFLQNSTTFHYGIGAGVGVNFSRRFGLYLDLNNEKFKYNVLRIGANVRF